MCQDHQPAVTRRTLLAGAGAAALLAAGARPAAAASATPRITLRSAWAGTSCPVRGPLPVEQPGGARFLLVHHTWSPGNAYSQADVPRLLRGIYRYHTGPEKNWPDVAYNFFVDKYGGIWEARAGSLAAPVIPSATGGTQGYSQIACFLGDHTRSTPTAAAQDAMVSVLAWLARRYQVPTAPGSTVTFTSRGSSRWPAGARVTTRTIEGHRAMSLTTCPGNAAYPLVRDRFPAAVTRLAYP